MHSGIAIVALLALLATGASGQGIMVGGCAGVSPTNKCGCCDAMDDMTTDNWCAANYDEECRGVSCGTVIGTAADKCECCTEKGDYLSDAWCSTNFDKKCKPGSTCDTVAPDVKSRCACCDSKNDWTDESWCRSQYNTKCKVEPTTCDKVAPDTKSRCKCCSARDDWTNEAWCRNNFDVQCQPKPPTCDQEYSNTEKRCQCCAGRNDWSNEKWCQGQYKSQCIPKPTCADKSTDTRTRCTCCKDTQDWANESWCRKNYNDQCVPKPSPPPPKPKKSPPPPKRSPPPPSPVAKPSPSPSPKPSPSPPPPPASNVKEFPWLVSLESPLGPCAGSLVAPGYVLTAASCVWDVNSGVALDPSNITLWVGGETIPVAFLNISDSWTAFEANASNHEPSGNYAMLALVSNSKADWVALPATDMAQPGQEVQQTAWQVDRMMVDTAKLTVLANCSEHYTDEFCAGGSKLLVGACPSDRGAPATQSVEGTPTQVGLTGGLPDCEVEAAEGVTFMTRLSDPEVLSEILDWMGQREGTATTGLSDGSRAWMAQARQYVESTPFNKK